MDNHRLALWCWLQHLPPNELIDVIHIDRHKDCRRIDFSPTEIAQQLENISWENYLSLAVPNQQNTQAIQWDNFLSLFIEIYRDRIGELYFCENNSEDDDPPAKMRFYNFPRNILLERLVDRTIVSETESTPFILDLDLDYFVTERNYRFYRHSRKVITNFFEYLGEVVTLSNCVCFTVALSPECCGGWRRAEDILEILSLSLNVDLSLER